MEYDYELKMFLDEHDYGYVIYDGELVSCEEVLECSYCKQAYHAEELHHERETIENIHYCDNCMSEHDKAMDDADSTSRYYNEMMSWGR